MTGARAVGASDCFLGDEPGADLAKDLLRACGELVEQLDVIRGTCEHTAAITNSAVVALGALLAARTLALVAHDVLRVGELGGLALVQLLERNLILLLYVGSLPGHIAPTGSTRHAAEASHAGKAAHSTHAAEHLREDVVHVWLLAAAAGGVESGHAVGIVEVALVIVGEDLVGLFRGLEPDLCFFALFDSDLVRVVC